MLNALVLVCSLAVTPDLASCNRNNAVHVLQVPAAFANPVSCLMHGQAYLATTAIGDALRTDERVKVVCAPITASTAAGLPAAVR
jgi:hypothetical protein